MTRIFPIIVAASLALALAGCVEENGLHSSIDASPAFMGTSAANQKAVPAPPKPSASSPDAGIRMENRTF